MSFVKKYFAEELVFEDGTQVIAAGAFSGLKKLRRIVLPRTVVTIEPNAFSDCPNLESVVVYEGLKRVGAYAFSGCVSLKNFIMPSTVMSIGDYAFARTGIREAEIPAMVSEVSEGLFEGCISLKRVKLHDGMRGIAAKAFSGCVSLELESLPKQLLQIGASAFEQCASIKKLVMPAQLARLSKSSFRQCAGLTELELNEQIAQIPEECFANCFKLEKIQLFEGLSYIGANAFSACRNLVFSNLPNTVREIKGYAFAGNSRLSSVELPDELIECSEYSFGGCLALKEVIVSGFTKYTELSFPPSTKIIKKNPRLNLRKLSELSKYNVSGIKTLTICNERALDMVERIPNIEELVIAEGCEVIGSRAFANLPSLKRLVLPSTLKSVEGRAFENCTALKQVVMCNSTVVAKNAFLGCGDFEYEKMMPSVTLSDLRKVRNYAKTDIYHLSITPPIVEIPASMFEDCVNTESVEIGSSVKKIGSRAFFNNKKLKKLVLPRGLKEIGKDAFAKCPSINQITLSDIRLWTSGAFADSTEEVEITIKDMVSDLVEEDGIIYSSDKTKLYFCANKQLSVCKVLDSVTEICDYAFAGCQSLTAVRLPEALKKVGEGAFKGCVNLDSVKLPQGLHSIGHFAFADCSRLSSVKLPAKMERMGVGAFMGCKALSYVKVPQVDILSARCFERCTSLNSVSLPDNIKVIGKGAFYGCSMLENVGFPDMLERVCESVFEKCTSLKEVRLPKMLETVEARAFKDCSSLTSVVVPPSLSKIEGEAFLGCQSLGAITLSKSCTTGKNAFEPHTDVGYAAYMQELVLNSIDDIAKLKGVERLNLVLGSNITSIPEGAFKNMQNIESIVFGEGLKTVGFGAFEGCKGLKSVSFANETAFIDGRAFFGCTALREINLPVALRNIGESAFEGCSSLRAATLGECTEINDRTFYGCTSLREITLPHTLNAVYWEAFRNCSSLEEIVLPAQVMEVDEWAFAGCKALKKSIIPTGCKVRANSFDGCDYLVRKEYKAEQAPQPSMSQPAKNESQPVSVPQFRAESEDSNERVINALKDFGLSDAECWRDKKLKNVLEDALYFESALINILCECVDLVQVLAQNPPAEEKRRAIYNFKAAISKKYATREDYLQRVVCIAEGTLDIELTAKNRELRSAALQELEQITKDEQAKQAEQQPAEGIVKPELSDKRADESVDTPQPRKAEPQLSDKRADEQDELFI